MAADLGKAYVQIVPSAKGIEGSIKNVLSGEGQSAGASLGKTIGANAKKYMLAAGIGVAVGKVIKDSIAEGAKLQQSYIGGLETLYKDAAPQAREYARAAAEAGISMNDYSEQAVSFGAALKNAYGGDVTKAAEAANTAILDMADNSAKMGTDIESVQMAYQGFAKQNYTMLDNLKLGYGGTKSEMERLLADAEKITGIHYDINNLGDVYDAIHVIQGDLGLTGVAAEEAAQTFTGSFNAMKAAGQNLLGSLALGEGVGEAMGTLMTSVSNFLFNNLIPMIGQVIISLPGAIMGFIQQGLPALISGFTTMLQNFGTWLSTAADGITAEKVTTWITTTIPKLISGAGQLIQTLAMGLLNNLPTIVAAIGQIGLSIIQGLGSALWGKITAAANGIKERFLAPINNLKARIKAIIDTIKGFFSFKIPTPHIPLPHFSISPAGWKLSDLVKGKIPSLGIEWYASGGIFDSPTVAGLGEAGLEAAVPLTPFWNRLDAMADSIVSGVGTVMAGAGGYGGDIHITTYLYPSGPKFREYTVKAYDQGKREGL